MKGSRLQRRVNCGRGRNSKRTGTRTSPGVRWVNCFLTQGFSSELLLTHRQRQWFPEREEMPGRAALSPAAMVTKWHIQNQLKKQQQQQDSLQLVMFYTKMPLNHAGARGWACLALESMGTIPDSTKTTAGHAKETSVKGEPKEAVTSLPCVNNCHRHPTPEPTLICHQPPASRFPFSTYGSLEVLFSNKVFWNCHMHCLDRILSHSQ